MLHLVERIAECDDGHHRMRPGDRIEGITLHMFAVPGVHDAQGIARFYRMHPKWTGGQMPYTYVIQTSGLTELALHIFEVGPHALRWSSPTIGVVWVGVDFNAIKPTETQWNVGVDLCAELCDVFELDPVGVDAEGVPLLAGHTERPHATKQRGKSCPGKLFDLDQFREDTRVMKREAAVQRLENALMVA